MGAQLCLARYLRRLAWGPHALPPLTGSEFRLSDVRSRAADEISEAELTVAKLNANCICKWAHHNPPNLFVRPIEASQAKNALYTTADGIACVPPDCVQRLLNYDLRMKGV